MITIDGLNKKQVAMLDKMWSIDAMEDLGAYIRTLNERDQQMALILLEMVRLEVLDQDTAEMTEFPDAEKIFKNL